MCEFGDWTLELRLTNLGCLAYIESRGSLVFSSRLKIWGLIIEEKILTQNIEYWCSKKTEDAPICALRLKIFPKMCGFLKFEDQRLKIGMLTLKI